MVWVWVDGVGVVSNEMSPPPPAFSRQSTSRYNNTHLPSPRRSHHPPPLRRRRGRASCRRRRHPPCRSKILLGISSFFCGKRGHPPQSSTFPSISDIQRLIARSFPRSLLPHPAAQSRARCARPHTSLTTSLSTNSGHNARNFCNFGVAAFGQLTKQTE